MSNVVYVYIYVYKWKKVWDWMIDIYEFQGCVMQM